MQKNDLDSTQKESGLENGYHHADEQSLGSSTDGAQAGMKAVEAVTMTWTTWSLVFAYIGIFLVAIVSSFDGQTGVNLTIYATSDFALHSLVSTVYVVNAVVNASIKPVMAKVANVFGRLEAFSFSIFLYMLGYIQMAASKNVQTYAAAQVFYSAGFTGVLILTQIFIADTSDLKYRALLSSLPDVPFLWTVWAGPYIAASLLPDWRWGYGMWAIILPVAFAPLAIALFVNGLKAKRAGTMPPRPWAGVPVGKFLKDLWFDLDVMGLLLLSAAFALILIPLTLAASAKGGWSNASIIAMIVVGCLCLVAFPFWEGSKILSPKPFMPLRMFLNRNLSIGCISGFFYFAVFYTSIYPYFNTYLQVVQSQGVVSAGHVVQVFSFTSTVASVVVGILIRFTKSYKYFIIAGSAIYLMGIGLMIRYRQENVSIGTNVGIQIAVGIGGGMFNVPMQLAVQAAVPHIDVASATAIFLSIIEVGGAVGSGISGAIWSNLLLPKLTEYLPEASKSQAPLIFGNFQLALPYAVGSPERIAINRAYQETMTTILTISVCLAAPVFILSFFVKDLKLDQIDQKVKGKVIGQGDVPDVQGEPQVGDRTTRSGFLKRWNR